MYALYPALSSGKRENHQEENHAYPVKPLKSPVKALYPLNDKTHHKANKKRLNNR